MPGDLEKTWQRTCGELRRLVPLADYHLWFEPLRLVGHEGTTLFVRAPSHIRGSVSDRLSPTIAAAAERALGTRSRIEVVDGTWRSPGRDGARGVGPAQSAHRPLNPKYTFGQFVIGDGNRLAHAAALAVAEMPSQAYNPLFIHGPPGLGKTHLLQAIGNYVEEHGLELSVRYTTVETFTADFLQAVRDRDTGPFKESFRKADVLLLDDVQFLAGKERTKEEFFHTFNSLYESGRQLVITSDRSPSDMGELEDRLRERFQCGLVAELEPPDLGVRLAILRRRARLDADVQMCDDTLEEIARRLPTSIRTLEGAMIRVVAYASLRGVAATPELARQVLERLYPRPARCPAGIDEIVAATAVAFGLQAEAILARDRLPGHAQARQVAMYLSRELTDASLPEIGRRIGGRNHSTVLHAHRKLTRTLAEHGECEPLASLRRELEATDS